ncbi:MAG: GDP-L-fucose synthase [Bacteriovoracaceae bacterium]|nr:GDP-L-fucose synthase [Bacteriovoracaceae bacterium]
MNKADKILILGSNGLVGSAITRELKRLGFENLFTPKRAELDLLNQAATLAYFEKNKPDVVFMAAALVGGIVANNTLRADFIFENLLIQQNVFNASFKTKVQNFLFLGSSCIYPKNAPQPLKEEYLLSSPLEQTNEPYAIAKIAGLKTTESFRRQYGLNWISVMPTNLYGPNDNYDLNHSHVIPGLIARMAQAIKKNESEFKVWGSGKPRREFLYVDDMARACIHVMNLKDAPDFMNIGTGIDIEIGELAKMIAHKMNFKGQLVFDTSKPDGTMRKLLDVSKITSLGWKPEVTLDEGLDIAIREFRKV